MKMKFPFLSLLLINAITLYSQEKEALARLEQALIDLSKKQHVYSLYRVIDNDSLSIKKISAVADRFKNINNPEIQRSLADLYADLARKANDQKTKSKLVERIVEFCNNKDTIEFGCSDASILLQQFNVSDFNTQSKRRLISYFSEPYPNPYLIVILGMLNLKELIPKFRTLLIGENDYPKSFARKALARMGDQESIDFWVNQFDEQNPFNDFKLLETLLYIRQPVSIPIFEKLLFSEEGLDPEEPGGKGDPYASFGMYYLGLLLEDFPIPTRRNERSWDEANFALARQWMLANKGKYKIRRDEF